MGKKCKPTAQVAKKVGQARAVCMCLLHMCVCLQCLHVCMCVCRNLIAVIPMSSLDEVIVNDRLIGQLV